MTVLAYVLVFVAGMWFGATLVANKRTNVGHVTLPPRPSCAPILMPSHPRPPTPPPPPKRESVLIRTRTVTVRCDECPGGESKFMQVP